MPGYVIHLAVANVHVRHYDDVGRADDFRYGAILPDLLPKPQSHLGPSTARPGLDAYLDTHALDRDENRGYFLHLLTDYLFYQHFLSLVPWSPQIYEDYNRLNGPLGRRYGVDVPSEVRETVRYRDDEPVLLRLEDVCRFIEAVGQADLDELSRTRSFDVVPVEPLRF